MREGVFDFSEIAEPRRSRMDELRVEVGGLWILRESFPRCIDDLLDVAMAVYVADRLVKRERKDGAWLPRRLRLKIPVAEPERWEELGPQLAGLLEWLTTDQWNLMFVSEKTHHRERPASALPLVSPNKPFVGLYSGGLDSFAGVVAQALDSSNDSAVLVGAQSGNRLKGLQAEQRELLKKRLPQIFWEDMRGFGHPYKKGKLKHWHISEKRQEKSQRARGFLFLVFGAVTAYAYDADALHVYENGVGGINLPYTSAFSGADMTRAMHPKTLLEAGQLFSDVFDQPFRIVNSSLWRTKGEMCAQLVEAGLADLVSATKSCDSYPLREAPDQCGLCTSCLLRRLSLHAAGLVELDCRVTHYGGNIYDMGVRILDAALRPYAFMLHQARKLEAITASGDMLEFRQAFDGLDEARYALKELTGMTLAKVDSELLSLYRRYASEVMTFHSVVTGLEQPRGENYDEELQRA